MRREVEEMLDKENIEALEKRNDFIAQLDGCVKEVLKDYEQKNVSQRRHKLHTEHVSNRVKKTLN